MTYTKQQWADGQIGAPYGPISAARLGVIEQGLADAGLWTTVRAAGGTTDDTATIQAAINAIPSTGGEIRFPDAQYVVNGTIDLTDKEFVRLVGRGSLGSPYSFAFSGGTMFKRLSGTGTMLKWEPTTAVTESLRGCGIQGITFNGNNLAATVISLKSIYGGEFRDIHIHDATSVGLALNTVNLTGVEDLQNCIFEKITIACATTATAKGITMGSWATGGGNTSVNVFTNLYVYTQNGTAVEMGDSDSNRFLGLLCNRSGTAIALDMLGSSGGGGHCRHNLFLNVDTSGAPINSRGTDAGYVQPATNNLFLLSRGDSTPTPTVGTGSVCSWIDTTGLSTLAGVTAGTLSAAGLSLTGGTSGIVASGAYTGYGIDLNGATYTSGPIRIANNTSLVGRKADNSTDVAFLTWNTSNEAQFLTNTRHSGDIIVGSGFNFQFSTGTGTKIGTSGGAAGQKIGFWNATPIVQPLLATGAAHTVDDVITALQNLGLCRQT
jgi:hypothetical protein